MTSSTSSSSRRAALGLVLAALATAAGGCARARPPASAVAALQKDRPKLVLLPVDNLAGTFVPTADLYRAIETSLKARFDVVSGEALEPFLSRHRIRYTGGVDREAAKAARDELGADVLLVTAVELYRPTPPPAIGIAMRLVSAGDEPAILWMDAVAHAGDEAPGLLRLGVVEAVQPLAERSVAQLAASLAAHARQAVTPRPGCGGAWYAPKVRFRSQRLDATGQLTLAVLPFLNQGGRRGSGDLVALEFVRHLVATGKFRVLEPGVVREYLLRARVMMPGGVSLETTRLMLGALGVDLVLSGVVLDFEDSAGPAGAGIRFTATMLDGGNGEVVWHASSYNRGDDGVFAFGLGRVRTSGELSCRMVGDAVGTLLVRKGSFAPREEPSRSRTIAPRTGRDTESGAPR